MEAHLEITASGATRGAERRDIVIVIDVLRASSTIITALSNGARKVVPTLTLAQAKEAASQRPSLILGGERQGVKPRGFDLGNSPREYRKGIVRGRTVVLTTTSGTKALTKARGARAVFVGSLINGMAVAKAAYNAARLEHADILLVASGKKGALSFEDLLCAGQVSYHLGQSGALLDDGCEIVALAWDAAKERAGREIWRSHHAQYLRSIGFEQDVEFCARVDASNMVPVLRDGAFVPLHAR